MSTTKLDTISIPKVLEKILTMTDTWSGNAVIQSLVLYRVDGTDGDAVILCELGRSVMGRGVIDRVPIDDFDPSDLDFPPDESAPAGFGRFGQIRQGALFLCIRGFADVPGTRRRSVAYYRCDRRVADEMIYDPSPGSIQSGSSTPRTIWNEEIANAISCHESPEIIDRLRCKALISQLQSYLEADRDPGAVAIAAVLDNLITNYVGHLSSHSLECLKSLRSGISSLRPEGLIKWILSRPPVEHLRPIVEQTGEWVQLSDAELREELSIAKRDRRRVTLRGWEASNEQQSWVPIGTIQGVPYFDVGLVIVARRVLLPRYQQSKKLVRWELFRPNVPASNKEP